jgi:hypothetical protein
MPLWANFLTGFLWALAAGCLWAALALVIDAVREPHRS